MSTTGLFELNQNRLPNTSYDLPAGTTKPPSTGGAGTSIGISTALQLVGSIMQTGIAVQDIKNKTNSAIKAIELETEAYKIQMSTMARQSSELDQQLFASMSQRGLEALKASARLKAASAETGTTGGTTKYATQQAFVDPAYDSAILRNRAKSEQLNILSRMDMADISLKNKNNEFYSAIMSPSAAAASMVSTSIGGLSNIYSSLPASARENLFNSKDS
jgi:hypothetical protein